MTEPLNAVFDHIAAHRQELHRPAAGLCLPAQHQRPRGGDCRDRRLSGWAI